MAKASAIYGLEIFAASLLNNVINKNNEQLFIRRTVGQMLFDGYDMPFLKQLSSLAGKLHINLPNMPRDGKFGLMHDVSTNYGHHLSSDT